MFTNQLLQFLDQELQMARNLGIAPIAVSDKQFEIIIAQGRVKWAINLNNELLFVPEFAYGQEIYHTVLVQGKPVLAAGLADIVGSEGNYLLLSISNYSGHYQPKSASLELAKVVFKQAGIDISYADLEIIDFK